MSQRSEIARILADNIKTHRKRLGLNQLEMAERVGVSEPTITAWESGKRWPGTDNIHAMAKEFDIPEAALFANPRADLQDIVAALETADQNRLDDVRALLRLPIPKPELKAAKRKP